MAPSAVTAFDPMFWFHHANVDRQLALYQAVFPDTYMGPCAAGTPTFTVERGEMLTADSGMFIVLNVTRQYIMFVSGALTNPSRTHSLSQK